MKMQPIKVGCPLCGTDIEMPIHVEVLQATYEDVEGNRVRTKVTTNAQALYDHLKEHTLPHERTVFDPEEFAAPLAYREGDGRIWYMARCHRCDFRMPFASREDRTEWADVHRTAQNPATGELHDVIDFWTEGDGGT